MEHQIPESLTHADVRTALKPFYDLLGVSDRDVYISGLSFSATTAPDSLMYLNLYVTARELGDEGERARGVQQTEGLAPRPYPTAELAWVCQIPVR